MLPSPAGDERHEQQDQKWYQRYQVLLFVGVTALFVLAVGLILDWYIDPQNSTQKKDLVQALGLITAWWLGPSASSSLGAANGSPEEAQEEGQRNTQAQLTNAQEELRLTRQGLHSALSYRSPADYEESTMEGVAVA